MGERKRLRLEWSEAKARENRRRHGVSFEFAKYVFDDELQVNLYRGHEHGEPRWWTIGMIGTAVLIVVHTWVENDDEEIIRIISARRATASERRRFEGG